LRTPVGYADTSIRDNQDMNKVWALRWWHGPVSVFVAAGVGVLTNLVTDEFSWTLATALVSLLIAQVTLSAWQARTDHHDQRTSRNALLGPLRPPMPDIFAFSAAAPFENTASTRAVVPWLTAAFSPTPLWGRSEVRDRLLTWCIDRDPQAGVVRVVTGPAGVGKTRLALAVAEDLPADWAAGRLQNDGAGLLERIAVAADPTLVIVDDADRISAPILEAVIIGAMRHPALIRLLLLTRTDTSLRFLSDVVLPQLTNAEVLAPIGEAGDRQRWFAQAVRAYARTWRVPPPDLLDRPVGSDKDTPLVLHARALLAVLGRSSIYTLSIAGIVTELVTLEQRTWQAELPRLPTGCDTEVLTEAVTVLLLIPAPTITDAAETLRRVPQFSHDASQESRVAVARWAHTHYPPGSDHRLNLRPHMVAERLLLDTLTRTPDLLRDDDTLLAAPVLARAYTTFPEALDQLVALLTRQREHLPGALAAIIATGVNGDSIDRALSILVSTDEIANDTATRAQLIALDQLTAWPHVQVACDSLRVRHYRALTQASSDQSNAALADALHSLGISLWRVGRWREALTNTDEAIRHHRALIEVTPEEYLPSLAAALCSRAASSMELGHASEALISTREAVGYYRVLTEDDPEQHRFDLAIALNNLALGLLAVGRPHEAVTTSEETVSHFQALTKVDPERYRFNLAGALDSLGITLRAVGRPHEALDATKEAVEHLRALTEADSEQYLPDLAGALNNLGNSQRITGHPPEALAATEEAVKIFRALAKTNAEQPRFDLAGALRNYGFALQELGRPQAALAAAEEAVTNFRALTKINPGLHRSNLAAALNDLGVAIGTVDRPQDALTAADEAVEHLRALAKNNPEQHLPELAGALLNLGIAFGKLGRPQDAIAATEEAIEYLRTLGKTNPGRHLPDLAAALNNLQIVLESAGDSNGALHTQREVVAVWQACAERDSDLYGPSLQRASAQLRRKLNQVGRHDEAVAHDLTDGSAEIP
jgi:tetratricopeptide (TPR) repeat protein